MATARIDRSDDTASVLKIIATISATEDSVTKQWQACTLADSTDPANNKLAIDSSGHIQCDIAAASVAISANPAPTASGGCSMYHKVAAASDNAASIKASPGQVYGLTIYNNAGYPVYVKLHNTAGTPTAGAGVVRGFGCQAGTQASYSQPMGLAFDTGIGITVVKDLADAGTTAVALSDAIIGIEYK